MFLFNTGIHNSTLKHEYFICITDTIPYDTAFNVFASSFFTCKNATQEHLQTDVNLGVNQSL